MITGLTHTMLFISDYDKAIDFYTQKLGLELRANMDLGGGMRWVSVGSTSQPNIDIVLAKPLVFGLIDEETATTLRKAVDKNAMGGGVFATDDCRKTYEELRGKGVEFVSPPQEQPYGVEAIFKDGCGNWFSLRQSPKMNGNGSGS